MTTYTAEDFDLAARRIAAAIERGEPGKIGLRHLRVAVVALRLVAAEHDAALAVIRKTLAPRHMRMVEAALREAADGF